jgi:hypothetical protein
MPSETEPWPFGGLVSRSAQAVIASGTRLRRHCSRTATTSEPCTRSFVMQTVRTTSDVSARHEPGRLGPAKSLLSAVTRVPRNAVGPSKTRCADPVRRIDSRWSFAPRGISGVAQRQERKGRECEARAIGGWPRPYRPLKSMAAFARLSSMVEGPSGPLGKGDPGGGAMAPPLPTRC